MYYGCVVITMNAVNVSYNPFMIYYGCLKERMLPYLKKSKTTYKYYDQIIKPFGCLWGEFVFVTWQ